MKKQKSTFIWHQSPNQSGLKANQGVKQNHCETALKARKALTKQNNQTGLKLK